MGENWCIKLAKQFPERKCRLLLYDVCRTYPSIGLLDRCTLSFTIYIHLFYCRNAATLLGKIDLYFLATSSLFHCFQKKDGLNLDLDFDYLASHFEHLITVEAKLLKIMLASRHPWCLKWSLFQPIHSNVPLLITDFAFFSIHINRELVAQLYW